MPTSRPHAGLARFLPFDAGGRIINTLQSAGSVFGNPLPQLGGMIVFGGLAVAVMVASLVLFRRRDA